MKLLLGLARPTSGFVFGNDILSESFQTRRRIGYLAQSPRYYGHMTARETLRFVARFFYSGPGSAIERRVDGSLSLAGLSDRADRRVGGFSGGGLQRPRHFEAFERVVTETLKGGDEVQITGFGKFSVRERKAREGRNPQTGEKMKIAASKVPSFSAGNTLKEAI
jgi:nucleoid DNA-binding protein